MSVSWGYSPKVEKFIPLGDFPADKYLIVAQQAVENLGWKLSHLSESGLIAYTPVSLQSYSEEISIRIHGNFAVVKSECVGIQMLFTDYGKNELNLERFFHEFEYVQFHLKEVWADRLIKFHSAIAAQDDAYFEKAPLAIKNKIKNVLYLFLPQKGYTVTPILVIINILYFLTITILSVIYFRFILNANHGNVDSSTLAEQVKNFTLNLGVNHRSAVLNGQYWRLITYQFIHGSTSHLFFNMYALIYLGLMIENKLGWQKFLFVYLLTGVCGGLVSLSFHQEAVMMGASGAIMGLYGAFLALIINKTFERKATQALLISTLIVSALILINGAFGKRIDNAAHIGGFIAGFVISYLLTFKTKKLLFVKDWIRYTLTAMLVLVFSVAIISFSPKYQTEEFRKLSAKFNYNLEYLNAVTNLKVNLPKDAKLKSLQEDGIIPMKNNLTIIREMNRLTLKEEDAKERDRKEKLGKASYRAVMLMYRDIKGDSTNKYSKQTSQALGVMFTILYK